MANSTQKLVKRYGNPPFQEDFKSVESYLSALKAYEAKNLVSWDIPQDINDALACLPNRLYCNKDLIKPLEFAFRDLITYYRSGKSKKLDSLMTFDGCYNIRKKRGLSSISVHAFAMAIDLNAFRNGLGQTPTFSAGFVKCFTDNGFIWGGTWNRKDGMHFELNVDTLSSC